MTPQPESPEPTSPAAADSSPGSSTGSGSRFVGDPGPDFVPGEGPPIPEDVGAYDAGLSPAVYQVGEDQIRDLLGNFGDGAHALFGVGEWDWAMTQRDLDRIAGPLTRIVNRYEPAARIAGQSDFLSLGVGVAVYSWRSVLERQAILAEQQQRAEAAGRPGMMRAPVTHAPPAASPAPAPAPPPAPAPAPPPAPVPAPPVDTRPPVPGPPPAQAADLPPIEIPAGTRTWADQLAEARERTAANAKHVSVDQPPGGTP